MTASTEIRTDDFDGIPLDVVDHVAELLDGRRIARAWEREGRGVAPRWNTAGTFWRDVLRRLAVRSIRKTAETLCQPLPHDVNEAMAQRDLLSSQMTRRRERQLETTRQAIEHAKCANRYAEALDPPFSEAIAILAERKEGAAADA